MEVAGVVLPCATLEEPAPSSSVHVGPRAAPSCCRLGLAPPSTSVSATIVLSFLLYALRNFALLEFLFCYHCCLFLHLKFLIGETRRRFFATMLPSTNFCYNCYVILLE